MRMSNADARRATSWPMRPSPASTSVFSRTSSPRNFFFSHLPCFIAESAAGTWRASDSMRPTASSATLMLLAPGAFITTTPRALAAGTSTLSTPVPARAITRSFGAASINASLAFATGDAARHRGDARLFLVSLAFLSAAGFLGLHALATPGVLVDGRTAGFVIATPIGLLIAAGFAAASAMALPSEQAHAVMEHARALRGALLAVIAAWAAFSLARLAPLDDTSAAEVATGPLAAIAVVAVGLYAYAAWRYLELYRERGAGMLLGITCAFVLLAEAMIAVAFARNWHATWWEWHLLMLAAFALVATSARHEWREERFSPLYLGETVAGKHVVSVVFADLCGFTAFSEHRDPR